jgi:hypothetical protein
VPNFLIRDYVDLSLETFDVSRVSHEIRHDGRTFYYGNGEVAEQLAQLLPEADRVIRPGDRLVVGTGDLRKTPLSEAFLYYLLPEAHPGTYYIEMDPGVANADDSRLAEDLSRAAATVLHGARSSSVRAARALRPRARTRRRQQSRRSHSVGSPSRCARSSSSPHTSRS